jgi:hypothetical protein
MQITIVETEIKTAIRNHILGLISVREDMKIDIDLRATRGQEGFTAIVDILPEDPSGSKPKIKTEAPVDVASEASVKTEPAAPKAATKAVVEEVAEILAEADAIINDEPVVAPTSKPQVIAFAKKTKIPAPAAAEATPESDTSVPPAKSIFAALGRPVNTPATAVNE